MLQYTYIHHNYLNMSLISSVISRELEQASIDGMYKGKYLKPLVGLWSMNKTSNIYFAIIHIVCLIEKTRERDAFNGLLQIKGLCENLEGTLHNPLRVELNENFVDFNKPK